ncbi:hypothetical protein SAMN05421504_108256 [Amycolatopsis xylanica]|uniref:Uncharacterized protein n=1 Tax=Amycolatopsis xylanica TaxID=589385 RepID=A0A1H3PK20_9PSEU|nr:hypothetical protein [Amycolatopsis xylanica]SDZ01390.1 hypothetical protein SAMN05421504_108256 [Amycolatopsis xylanica]
MDPAQRAAFVANYSTLVAAVWSDPNKEEALVQNPEKLVAEFGIEVPEGVMLSIERDGSDVGGGLQTQVDAWQNAAELGVLTLYIPTADFAGTRELAEEELDSLVAGLDSSCACCSPCCSV